MLTVAPPDAAEIRCNATFEALMWALSRPGDLRELPEPGLGTIVETLVDLECQVFVEDAALAEAVAATGADRTNDLARADHVFLTSIDDVDGLARLNCGTDLYPDDGATAVVVAQIGSGQRLRLSGPGVNGSVDVAIAVPVNFWALREALCPYPEGFDLLFVDGRSVLGIPRSTKVEVL